MILLAKTKTKEKKTERVDFMTTPTNKKGLRALAAAETVRLDKQVSMGVYLNNLVEAAIKRNKK